jgi:hypothetical protein
VFAPGIHQLTKTQEIRHANQGRVGSGICYDCGTYGRESAYPCIHVAPKTPSARIAGVCIRLGCTRQPLKCKNFIPLVNSMLKGTSTEQEVIAFSIELAVGLKYRNASIFVIFQGHTH